MKTAIMIGVLLLTALVAVAPTASAGPPECFQVYPWSQLCKGDAGAVVCYYVEGAPEEVCEPIR